MPVTPYQVDVWVSYAECDLPWNCEQYPFLRL